VSPEVHKTVLERRCAVPKTWELYTISDDTDVRVVANDGTRGHFIVRVGKYAHSYLNTLRAFNAMSNEMVSGSR
jgi:hypothetical protein